MAGAMKLKIKLSAFGESRPDLCYTEGAVAGEANRAGLLAAVILYPHDTS
jgi:hypothetical protein